MATAPRVRIARADDIGSLARLVGAFRDFLGATEPGDAAIRRALGEVRADPAHERALGFYRAHGFANVGEARWGEGREVLLDRSLVEDPATPPPHARRR